MSTLERIRQFSDYSLYTGLAATVLCTVGLVWGTARDGQEKDASTVRTASIVVGGAGMALAGAGIAAPRIAEHHLRPQEHLTPPKTEITV